jgi:CBS domain-containing protein
LGENNWEEATMKTVRKLLASKGHGLHKIGSDATVMAALESMATNNVGALLVVDDGKLVGILSERDYARKVALAGLRSTDVPVRDIMTTNVTTVRPEQTIEHCMALMSAGRFRHLPVLDDGALVGVLSIGDLVKAVIADQAERIQNLEEYIQS